jgi:hypothetical protein
MKYQKDKKNIEDVRIILQKNGFIVISKQYAANKKLEVRCQNGHFRKSYFYTLKNITHCSKCTRKTSDISSKDKVVKNKKESRDFIKIVNEMGFVYVKKVNKYMHLKCNKNHEFLIATSTLLNYKSRNKYPCVICSNKFNKKEEECRNIFEELTGFKFFKLRPEWLVNHITGKRLELDGYCEELKLAFEYDTPEHFCKEVYTQTHGIISNTESSISIRDSIKDVRCKEVGVYLIRINNSIEDIKKYVSKQLKERN